MPKFADKDEEISYWQKRAEELEAEFDDLRESSQNIEQELEASLDQAEKANKDLRMRNNRLQLDNDTLKDKVDQMTQELTAQLTDLQDEVTQSRNREENYVKYIRELEQKNDDLERAQRAMYVSLAEFETKLNSTIERNVLLESELDEKEQLKTMVQRLKDELRDLKQETQCRDRDRCPDNDIILSGRKSSIKNVDTNKMAPTTPTTPLRTLNMSMGPPVTTPNVGRISAMNIVGDLLRRIGALESTLATCRNNNLESIAPTDKHTDSYRTGRRLNRGTSTPSIHNLDRS